MLSFDFMQRALLAALLVGVVAPVIGVHLVQRRLALLGDGMGHVALTGVGISFLMGSSPMPTALVVAVGGSLLVELVRTRSRAAGDLALALLFYGGIAGGVMLSSFAAARRPVSLTSYLFGAISTVTRTDVKVLVVTAAVALLLLAVFGPELLSLSIDSDSAAIRGIRVRAMGMLLSALAAVTVVIGMRTVGLLLVSAIMIVPVAASQQLARSFRGTMLGAVVVSVLCCLTGVTAGFYASVPPGPAIVLLALVVFAISAVLGVRRRSRVAKNTANLGAANETGAQA